MNVELVKISVADTERLWTMQVKTFQNLLEKYQDFETSPANETKEKIRAKLTEKMEAESEQHRFLYWRNFVIKR